MSKEFHYEVQQYQEECVGNIVKIFDLIRTEDFGKVIEKHQRSMNYSFGKSDSKNIDIMMETGTGKTFTFIKTMFELHKKFGYKKFIIMIPTVPIREGTKANLEDTREYFKSLYANNKDKEITPFVYEGGNISVINSYINYDGLSVLVLTPSSFNSKDNLLNKPLERDLNNPVLFKDEQRAVKSYLEAIKRLQPIVIMDEPHRFDGDAFKKYFAGFENYYLRFGATFPKKKNSLQLSNVAYVLDSISSFRRNLVKRITVYTQDLVEQRDTLISIENKKAEVDRLTNGIVMRVSLVAGNKFNGKNIKKVNAKNILLEDGSIEEVDYSLSDESIRTMIRQTIEIHFSKEKVLFEQGIKALTLFFIESDKSLYRGEDAKVRRIFEEEYVAKRSEVLEKLEGKSEYAEYLGKDFDEDGKLQVHKGYFSGDKGTKEEAVKAGVDEILRDKKGLLSFESSTRFIFSIWALQEGWDNPNVFTICKLSNYGSENSKLQQIGRGLRLCVNQELERMTIKSLENNQQKFWEINNLDVVVSHKEQGFVEGIQKEILENSHLIGNNFTQVDMTRLLQEKTKLDGDEIVELIDDVLIGKGLFVRTGLVNGDRAYEKCKDFLEKLNSQDISEELKRQIAGMFANDINNIISNGNKKKEKKKVFIKNTHLQEFRELWESINCNAVYMLERLGKEEELQLVSNIVRAIERLQIEKKVLKTTKEILHAEKIGKGDAITGEVVGREVRKNRIDYIAMAHKISEDSKTPLHFVVKVLNSISKEFKEGVLANNPAQAEREIVGIIGAKLVETIKTEIVYKEMKGRVLPDIFQMEKGKAYLEAGNMGKYQKEIEEDFSLKSKWIFEEVIEYDSDFELKIIEGDPNIEEIEIFGKLPRLNIKTPIGNYNPDFCYTIKSKGGKKIFLIVEAKGYERETDIPVEEASKIYFAQKYFEALQRECQGGNVEIRFKKRINTSDLISLIEESV